MHAKITYFNSVQILILEQTLCLTMGHYIVAYEEFYVHYFGLLGMQ